MKMLINIKSILTVDDIPMLCFFYISGGRNCTYPAFFVNLLCTYICEDKNIKLISKMRKYEKKHESKITKSWKSC